MPVLDRDGRPRSVRTAEEEVAILTADMSQLPEGERLALVEMYELLKAGEHYDFEQVANIEFETPPVDIRTYLTDPYFLGETGGSLWDRLKDDLVELFEGDYHECTLGGSLGWGKTFFATTAISYVLYQMSCLRDPQSAYGIAPGSHIYLAMLSVTERVARRVPVNELIGKITHSRYFKEKFPSKAAPSLLEVRFPKQIMVVAGSTGSSAILGMNAFAGFIDETSFMGTAKEIDRMGREVITDKGEAIYKSIIRRMKSRFMKVGRLPGLMILASSKERPTAFVEKRIEQAREQVDPHFFVREYATWDVKTKGSFTDKTFKVVVGNEKHHSRILDDPADEEKYLKLELKIIEVPVEYKPDFERDLDGAIRDIAGYATISVSPYIHRTEMVYDAADDTLVCPLSGGKGADMEEEWLASTPLDIHWGTVARSFQRRISGGYTETAWRPIRHPDAIRYAHIDPSLSGDCSGLTIAHIAGWTEVVRRSKNMEEYSELAPIIETDLVLKIIPPPGDEILLSDVRAIIYQFCEHGFNVRFVTMDSYQCLAKGTLVHTSRGVLPIEDVEAGDLVQSRSGPRKVTNRWAFGEQKTLQVITQDGDVLEATERHRVEAQVGWTGERQSEWGWTRDPVWEWVEVGRLRVGDVVRICDAPTELDPPDAWLVGVKSELGWRCGGHKPSTIDAWEFPESMTPELAEWIGLVWGDGQIQCDGVRLTVTSDEAADAGLVFERLFGVVPRYRSVTDVHGTLSVSARWLTRWLDLNGLCKPEIPVPIMRSSKASKAAFLRGIFAADGNVSRSDGSVSLSTKHRALADQVRLVLRVDFGIESCLTTVERGKTGDYVDHGRQYVVGLRGPRRRFAEQIGFSYSRKSDELEKHLGVRGRRKFVKVVSICESSADVFDLEVEGNPSYVANGFVSHNSADALQQLRKRGIEAEILSVDKTTDPYDLLKTTLYEKRIRMHQHTWCQRELTQLQRAPKPGGKGYKVDHPKIGADGKPGTKDVADSLAAVVYNLTQRAPSMPIPIQPGLTDRDVTEVEDHSWVTDGKSIIIQESRKNEQGGGIVGTRPEDPGSKPMPFIKG